jgi:glycosyltransferase involved in cell wall biosynthesis
MGERLGVYIDAIYRVSGEPGARRVLTQSQCLQFLRFACAVGANFESLVLFGREAPADVRTEFALPLEGNIDIASLPYYSNLGNAREVVRAAAGVIRGMWSGLDKVDVVWVFGPYPFSLVLVAFALARRRRVVLGIRQDTMRYWRSRLRGRWMVPLLAPLWLLDGMYRLLARRLPTTVVGDAIERHFGGPRTNVLNHVVSVVRRAEIAAVPRAPDGARELRLLTVGRIEPEKAPLMLVECLAALDRASDGYRFRLTWAGTGALAPAMRERASELGVADRLELPGYVPFGPALLALYRQAHVFVHCSLTEGVPQVLIEAMAAGLPIVATDVGGVASLLDGTALLVPPGDADALVRTLRSVASDGDLRTQRARRALDRVVRYTLESESERVARFIAAGRVTR